MRQASLAAKLNSMATAVEVSSDTLAFTACSRLAPSDLGPRRQARASRLNSISDRFNELSYLGV